MSHKDNMTRIKIVRNTLGELANGSIVGGATVSLCTDRMLTRFVRQMMSIF